MSDFFTAVLCSVDELMSFFAASQAHAPQLYKALINGALMRQVTMATVDEDDLVLQPPGKNRNVLIQ